MHTRHAAVFALGAIASVMGISGAEIDQASMLVTAIISALGIADWIKARLGHE